MTLEEIHALIKKNLDAEAAFYGISDIDDPDQAKRTIGIETENGALFFLTVQPA